MDSLNFKLTGSGSNLGRWAFWNILTTFTLFRSVFRSGPATESTLRDQLGASCIFYLALNQWSNDLIL